MQKIKITYISDKLVFTRFGENYPIYAFGTPPRKIGEFEFDNNMNSMILNIVEGEIKADVHLSYLLDPNHTIEKPIANIDVEEFNPKNYTVIGLMLRAVKSEMGIEINGIIPKELPIEFHIL